MIEQAGADYIGINLVAGPRRVTLETAERIVADARSPAKGQAGAVALLEARDAVDSTLGRLKAAGFACVQLYGEVTVEVARRVRGAGLAPWLVVHVGSSEDAERATLNLQDMRADEIDLLVVDANAGGVLGGTGQRADWKAIQGEAMRSNWPPIMLAGGLRPENVADAIRAVTPFAVDVSSGVEKNPGLKDQTRVENFIRAVRSA